jgi:hypothetical protein
MYNVEASMQTIQLVPNRHRRQSFRYQGIRGWNRPIIRPIVQKKFDNIYENLTQMPPMTAITSLERRSLTEKRFALYGVAVGAALAAGAGAPNAEANLVTLDLTGLNTTDRSTNSTGNLYFDVNASTAGAAVSTSGTFSGADFQIFTGFNFGFTGPYASISGLTANNGIAGQQEGFFKASNLTSSHLVGPTDSFRQQALITSYFGQFAPGDTGYLGLKFEIGSDIHYGWANITVGADADYPNITLNALGYETNPDTPAHTEAPSTAPGVPDQGSTFAMMAVGAAGLIAFRSAQRKNANSLA